MMSTIIKAKVMLNARKRRLIALSRKSNMMKKECSGVRLLNPAVVVKRFKADCNKSDLQSGPKVTGDSTNYK